MLYGSLRGFDIKYPRGLGEAHLETIRGIEANYPAEEGDKRSKLVDGVQLLQNELTDLFKPDVGNESQELKK